MYSLSECKRRLMFVLNNKYVRNIVSWFHGKPWRKLNHVVNKQTPDMYFYFVLEIGVGWYVNRVDFQFELFLNVL